MSKKVLILGGYGTFGRRITQALCKVSEIECIVAGRRPQRARKLIQAMGVTALEVDVTDDTSLKSALEGVFAVVNTCGPFHETGYNLARACARKGIHYVDLADSRDYVKGITRLDKQARASNCLIVAGASSVPTLSAALVDVMADEFDRIDEIHSAISPGNKNPRGVATMRSILSYTGTPIRVWLNGRWADRHGWSDSEKVRFPSPVGGRRVYLCNVPDLDIFPKRYGARTVTFRAGLELSLFNIGLYLLGVWRRWGWIGNLPDWAGRLLLVSNWFKPLGGYAGGMRVLLRGEKNGKPLEHAMFLIARDDNGPLIPCSPAIALIKQWVRQGVSTTGAMPCVGLLTLDDITEQLKECDIVLVRT